MSYLCTCEKVFESHYERIECMASHEQELIEKRQRLHALEAGVREFLKQYDMPQGSKEPNHVFRSIEKLRALVDGEGKDED